MEKTGLGLHYTTNMKFAIHVMLGLFLLTTFVMPNTLINGIMKTILTITLLAYSYIFRVRMTINGYCFWSAIFLIYALTSIGWSNYPVESALGWQALARNMLLGILVSMFLSSEKDIRRFCWMTVCAGCGLSLFLFLITNISSTVVEGIRIGTEELNANDVSIKMTVSSMMAYALFRITQNKIYFAAILIQMPWIMLSGSRKGFLLFLGVLILYRVFSARRVGTVLKTLFKLGLIVCIGVYVVLDVEPLYNVLGVRLESLYNYALTADIYDASLRERLNFVETGWILFHESMLWGHGINTFGMISGYMIYAHNNYIEVAVGLGIVGVVIWYYMYIMLITGLRKVSKDDIAKMLMAVFIVMPVLDVGLVNYLQDFYHVLIALGFAVLNVHNTKKLA